MHRLSTDSLFDIFDTFFKIDKLIKQRRNFLKPPLEGGHSLCPIVIAPVHRLASFRRGGFLFFTFSF